MSSTQQLANDWALALSRVSKAKSELNSAECAASNATNQLGRQLAPPDMKVGEVVSCWCRFYSDHEECVVVKKLDDSGLGTYYIERRGKRTIGT